MQVCERASQRIKMKSSFMFRLANVSLGEGYVCCKYLSGRDHWGTPPGFTAPWEMSALAEASTLFPPPPASRLTLGETQVPEFLRRILTQSCKGLSITLESQNEQSQNTHNGQISSWWQHWRAKVYPWWP